MILAIMVIPAVRAGARDTEPGGLGLLDAVKITLQNQPDIRLTEQDVAISRGKLQVEAGAFDTNFDLSVNPSTNSRPLGSLEQIEYGGLNEVTNITTTTAGVSKEFRNGITINPNVGVQRSEYTPLLFGTSLDGPSNTATVDFEITIPLLRGRGVEAADANEIAARKDLEVSELTLRHSISTDVLSTVLAYWDYVTALKAVDQAVDAENRAKKLAGDMKDLIAGGEKPACEMEQVLANLDAKASDRLAAEQKLVDARHGLGLAMGLEADQIDLLGSAQNDFPQMDAREIHGTGKNDNRLIGLALQRRADYLGSKKAEESAKVLVVAAKIGLRPKLDLTVGAGYNGLNEGRAYPRYIYSLTGNVGGYNASVMLTYKWPIENNAATGALLQKEAAYQKTEISTRNLARNIGSRVLRAMAALRNVSLEVARRRDAVRYYRRAVEDEKQRNALGTATTIDLITTEEHLTSALSAQLSAQAAFAKALAQLRYETGTLLREKGNRVSVGYAELTTLPRP